MTRIKKTPKHPSREQKRATGPRARSNAQSATKRSFHRVASVRPVEQNSPRGKLGTLVAMLQAPKGASIEELCKATGWQAHSVRGAISGALKKRFGLKVTSTKVDKIRTYRIAR